jgi:putative ABC transport system permease protein
VVQVAVSTTVLIGAGLLLRTVGSVTAVDPGFRVDGGAIATIDLSREGLDDAAATAFWRDLLSGLAAAPGVDAVALGRHVPVDSSGMRATLQPVGYAPAPDEDMGVALNVVSPGWFATLGAPLLAGRELTADDREGTTPVGVVNEAFVRRFWGSGDGVGRRIADFGPTGGELEVVGVVRDHHTHSLREPAGPAVWVPFAQADAMVRRSATVVVRGGDLDALQATLRGAVARLDPSIPLFREETLAEHVGAALGRERALAGLLTALAVLSLLLALLGLYAVLAFAVEIRKREIGVRSALGATAGGIARNVVGGGLRLTAAGIALGALLALPAARALQALLFGVAPHDPLALLAAAGALLATAALAAWLPARRAGRIDPMTAIREG